MDPAATVAGLVARLARMPYPKLGQPEIGVVERAFAAGFAYVPGLPLNGSRVLARRVVERALVRARERASYERRTT